MNGNVSSILTHPQNLFNMNNGYKGMLRDRLLPSWNLALLWCKVKQRWIDVAYERNIRNIPKELRSENCKFITGHKNKHNVSGTFMSSVDPDGFLKGDSPEEYEMWVTVNAWINWFSRHQMFIYDIIKDYYNKGYDDNYIIKTLKYHRADSKLIEFMVKNKHIYYGQN